MLLLKNLFPDDVEAKGKLPQDKSVIENHSRWDRRLAWGDHQ